MSNFEIEIGKRVRKLREKAGYSRDQLSEMAKIGSKFLYEIENGKKGMSAYTLYNLASALNVSCDYIMMGRMSETNLDYVSNILTTLSKEEMVHIEQIIKHIVELKNKR